MKHLCLYELTSNDVTTYSVHRQVPLLSQRRIQQVAQRFKSHLEALIAELNDLLIKRSIHKLVSSPAMILGPDY